MAYVSVPVGLLATALGVYGDTRGWWDNRGFLTNLVSSFTSLLFGVPTALVVLSHLQGKQAEAMERRAVKNRAEAAKQAYRELALQLVRPEARTNYGVVVAGFLVTGDEIRQGLERNPPLPGKLHELYEKRVADFRGTFTGEGRELVEWIESMLLLWEQMDSEIRPLIEGAGLRWMPLDRYRELRVHHERLASIDRSAVIREVNTLNEYVRNLSTGSLPQRRSAVRRLGADCTAFQGWTLFVVSLERILHDIEHIAR
ncbi:hypothetical protein ACF08W_28980 [Streptomyces sp. NPDC015144]|uniref:hypothetical protein n=1 Tax=Streptomyces sp. NPDC015144 TaxID=3364944 RepID=UPI0036F9A2CA